MASTGGESGGTGWFGSHAAMSTVTPLASASEPVSSSGAITVTTRWPLRLSTGANCFTSLTASWSGATSVGR